MLNNLLVFDIETIPDITSGRNLLNDYDSSDAELHIKLAKYHKPAFEEGVDDPNLVFFKPAFHKVVAISFMHIEISREGGSEVHSFQELRSGGNAESNEKELIDGFFSFIAKHKPKLVSYNGRSFDFPVLQYRALKYQTNSFGIYQLGDKWNSYMQRYSTEWHCDLLEVLSNFGASTRISMNDLCAVLDIPGKIDVDGLAVYNLYKADKVSEIRDYCETDVLNTYLIYLKYALHMGIMNKSAYDNAVTQIESFLAGAKEYVHYDQFLQKYNTLNNVKTRSA
ncbi:MAG: 3'-5' exonuclease [Rickettsiales bacterium]|jgi:3'-5' exonuclease|nr:3'-5' exonuclease [Rickettsiales bacterium]